MTTRQWLALIAGLLTTLVVAWFALDGWLRAIVAACVALGSVASAVERRRNLRRIRSTRR